MSSGRLTCLLPRRSKFKPCWLLDYAKKWRIEVGIALPQVVGLHAFYSNDPSSNPADIIFLLDFAKKWRKEIGTAPLFIKDSKNLLFSLNEWNIIKYLFTMDLQLEQFLLNHLLIASLSVRQKQWFIKFLSFPFFRPFYRQRQSLLPIWDDAAILKHSIFPWDFKIFFRGPIQ